MSKIYLINVGANTAHTSQARGAIHPDGSFVYVSFPEDGCGQHYPVEAQQHVKNGDAQLTHLDPDWDRLSYGDNCANPRARALGNVVPGDWLLYWALLWSVPDKKSSALGSNAKGWYLIGALKVSHVLSSGASLAELPSRLQVRAKFNAHVEQERRVEGRPMARVFLSDEAVSLRFNRAVDLGIGRAESLLQQVVLAADGRRLGWNSKPKWNSSTRACRAILNLDSEGDRERITTLEKAIKVENPMFAGFLSPK
mgnify:CR=1 FL=1